MQEDLEQQEQEARGGPSNDGVRSPIAARNDILVHPDMDYDTEYGYPPEDRAEVLCPFEHVRC